MKKIRLDMYLAQSGLSQTREKARREIIAGWVKVNGETVKDPSKPIAGSEHITVQRPGGLYVSRGGQKLEFALERFGISIAGKVAADLGASTGGFTDCLLQHGAAKVYAVDVGYGQLDFSLRKDPRVVVMEKTNARSLGRDDFPGAVDFIAADLSFISIVKVFDAIREAFSPAEGIILIKPQFEAGPGDHKKGVVRSKEAHVRILNGVISSLLGKGMSMMGLVHSPIKGPKGNIEFLLHFRCGHADPSITINDSQEAIIRDVVARAHQYFEEKSERAEFSSGGQC
jgi:23S rRNA (cytidine1920-2'-O)/16S rRNA (cytidine1409-2'-O)-methyltransferase